MATSARAAAVTAVAARTLAVAAAAGLGALAWGTLVERHLFTLRRVNAALLPPGAAPITVLHLSDLHLAPWQRDKQRWVRSLAALQPDLIVNTGDNTGHPDVYDELQHTLGPFRKTPGVFVNGSNDYWAPRAKNPLLYFKGPSAPKPAARRLDLDREHEIFSALGWHDLDNTGTSLVINGTRLEFVGLDDPHLDYDQLESVPGTLDELRDAGSRSGGAPSDAVTIGVAHAPYRRVLDAFVANGADLIFAGHTHGGQVCVPFYGALVTNCDIPRKQVKGLSSWRVGAKRAVLNVSAGLGTSIYAPIRFACLPEATLLTLTARA